jgi:hypothetical protein
MKKTSLLYDHISFVILKSIVFLVSFQIQGMDFRFTFHLAYHCISPLTQLVYFRQKKYNRAMKML